MTYLQLLFRSFYDIPFIKNYAKSGKGTGVALMCLLAFIMTSIFALPFFNSIPSTFGGDKINVSISQIFDKLPPLVIDNGELVWEDNVVETFILAKNAHLVIDTENTTPSISQIGEAIFYLTRNDLYVNNKGKIQSVAWSDIQASFDDTNPLDLTSEEVKTALIGLVKYMVVIGIILLFVLSFLLLWMMNGILSSLSRTIATKIYPRFRDMDYYEIRRTASVAVTPPLILVTISQAILGLPSFFVKVAVVITLGVLLINMFTERKTTENK